MKGYRRLIPSLNALVDFEAVARLKSFTLAADELGVTQAAVSRQIRFLEDAMKLQLFHRLHRSIALTKEGEALFLVTSESLQKIAGTFDSLSSNTREQEFAILATAAFSQFRILPRLPLLKRSQPQLKLRLTTQMFTADLRHNEVDIAIRYGSGSWRDGHSTLLFNEEVVPVCSPSWLEAHGEPQSLQDISDAPLIAYDSTSEGWMGWEDWFDAVGIKRNRLNYALRCSLYTDAIQAALQGQGVVLGWRRMLGDMLTSGRLVPLGEACVKMTDAYYAVVPHGHAVTPAVDAVIEWLREEPAA
jgi:DNA-binding transcriptional LysR family regulator